ncbi:GNAT family N-acetyltransferase [Rathayibacter sp. VKM Ac-2754]|uniref:GNAT family N-acetyltransferase n=1 Tax=Rathayibacter sp. VKM Ac-2754 TaxID=2609251 RepID=UPI0013583D99|nr:GNAT family N-acetyltransferase [Rathayibacter sp. VKM Ac-2754]MWV58909.1 GNAT family N-acetyltransferase [Rathayibacter sp. VKM Ac-2754]
MEILREYRASDAAATLEVFLAAVTETAAADYSPEQIRAWARADDRDVSAWHTAMQARRAFVIESGGAVVGFSDVAPSGCIDMMFVSPRFLRRGVATRLLEHAESLARQSDAAELSADVSITARPFFESRGFTVVAEQHPVRAGVALTNFRMRKPLR